MIPRPPLRIPDPDDLALPLRDLIRGVQQAALIPMALALPVVSHLPGPLRETLSHIGQRAEAVYKDSLTIWRPTVTEIWQASTLLTDARTSDLSVTGRVVVWVMEVALAQEEGHALFISETVVTLTLGDALAELSADTTSTTRAAHAILALIDHGLGPSPKVFPNLRMTPERTALIRVAAFAAMLFLLAKRPENADGEMRILSYAITIAELIAADIHTAAGDTAAVAELLRCYAEMI